MTTQLSETQLAVAGECKSRLDAAGISIAAFAAWAAGTATAPATQKNTLRLVMVYAGLLLIFSGIGTFIGMHWKDFGSALRILMTAGLGIAALNGTILVQRRNQWPEFLPGAYLISLFLLTSGLFVTLHELSSGNDQPLAAVLVFGSMLVMTLALLPVLRQPVLVFAALLYLNGMMWGVMEKAHVNVTTIAFATGLMNWLVAYGLQGRGYGRTAALANVIGLFSLAFAVWDVFARKDFWDLLLIAAGGAVMWYGTKEKSSLKLILGAIQVFASLVYFTNEYFADVAGWPLCLILLGAVSLYLAKTTHRLMDRGTG